MKLHEDLLHFFFVKRMGIVSTIFKNEVVLKYLPGNITYNHNNSFRRTKRELIDFDPLVYVNHHLGQPEIALSCENESEPLGLPQAIPLFEARFTRFSDLLFTLGGKFKGKKMQSDKITTDGNGDFATNDTASNKSDFTFSSDLSLEDLRKLQLHFITERNWNQFHKPRNVLLAMIAEVGELSEIFQWKDDVTCGLPDFTETEKNHVAMEMSDVLLYLMSLAHHCKIDLPAAVLRKLEANSKKYPKDKVQGKSDKYTAYQ